MGFSRYKPKLSAHLAPRKGVLRDYVEDAQGNTGEIRQPYDSKSINPNRHALLGTRSDQVQAYRAAIRSEAVLARKLAEQIDNLSQNAPKQTRKQADMTDSTTIDDEKTVNKQRRVTDKPRAASVRSGFNPLHPSMELPPEQLIRLLGLESKKIRKHKRSKPVVEKQAKASPNTDTGNLPPELERTAAAPADRQAPAPRSTHRQREYERAKERSASKSSRRLWIPALAAGIICGAAASAYLFWMPPQHNASSTPAAPVPNKVNRHPVATPTGKPVVESAPVKKSAPTSATKPGPAWQATIESREKTLLNEAEQRFEKRLKQAEQVPRHHTSPTAPDIAPPHTDAAKTEIRAVEGLPVATLPASMPQPETADTGLPEEITTPPTEATPVTVPNDELPVEEFDNSMDIPGPEPLPESLQTPETTPVGDSNPGALHNEEHGHSMITNASAQNAGDDTDTTEPSDEIPASENPESYSELPAAGS